MAENNSLYEKLGGNEAVTNFIKILSEKLLNSNISDKIKLIK